MFKRRHFDRAVILLCVRWYLAYNLSLRKLEEMMAERGISVDHTTDHRWIIRYSPELLERFNFSLLWWNIRKLLIEGCDNSLVPTSFESGYMVWLSRRNLIWIKALAESCSYR